MGTIGNILAAAFSFFVWPGVGQLFQGRVRSAIGFAVLCLVLWTIFLGWIINILAAVDAALYEPPTQPPAQVP